MRRVDFCFRNHEPRAQARGFFGQYGAHPLSLRPGLVVGVCLFFICACSRAPDAPTTKAQLAPDIVSLSPAASVTLRDLGLSSRLAGVTADDPTCPPGCVRLGRIGALDSESLLAIAPKIVIATGSGDMALDAAVRAQAKRFALVLQPSPTSVAQAFAQVEEVGAAVGRAKEANALVAQAKAHMAALEASHPRPAAPLRVLLIGSVSPQVGAFGPGFVHDELLQRLGVTNALPAGSPGWVSLDREALIRLAPEAVVWMSQEPQEQGALVLAGAFKGLPIPAVKNQRVVFVSDPLALIPATNLPQIEQALAEAIFRETP